MHHTGPTLPPFGARLGWALAFILAGSAGCGRIGYESVEVLGDGGGPAGRLTTERDASDSPSSSQSDGGPASQSAGGAGNSGGESQASSPDASGGQPTVSDAGVGPVTPDTGPDASAPGAEGAEDGGAVVDPDALWVTTAEDENDSSASIDSPGSTGLSLREAIALASMQAGADRIRFSSEVQGAIVLDSVLVINQAQSGGVRIIGDGQAIDCSVARSTQICITIQTDDVTLEGLDLVNCPGRAVYFGSPGGALLDSQLIGCGKLHVGMPATGSRIIGNQLQSDGGDCIQAQASSAVENNHITGCYRGILLNASSQVRGNLIYGADIGISASTGSTGSTIDHNTLVDITGDAVLVASNSGSIALRNNVMASVGRGLGAGDSDFTQRDNNLYWDIGAEVCTMCTIAATSFEADPLFVNPGQRDYRPGSGSPLIDRGVNTMVDRNGAQSGLFNGSAPDIGYFEL